MTHIDPTRGQFDAFKALDRDAPCDMLNLVKLRDTARYPEEHPNQDKGLSGAEAYALYGREGDPVLARVGGRILWRGAFRTPLIGPADEHWDHVFIARRPSAHAFMAMVKDADSARAVVHRQAAAETSRLIRCNDAETGDVFG